MTRFIFYGFCLFTFASYAYGTCERPRYKSVDSLKSSVGLLRIVIDQQDFSLRKLVCLAETRKEQNPAWRNVSLLIFMSKDSANAFRSGPRVELPAAAERAQSELHALYSLDRDKREEYLDILPFGWRTESSDATRIRLPVVETPHCRFEMKDRCLIGLDHFEYPAETLKAGGSGAVGLAGTITPAGKITNIHVESTNMTPPEEEKRLINAAEHNLASWHVEPRDSQDSIRIDYRYLIAPFVGPNGINANFELPKQVVIRGNR